MLNLIAKLEMKFVRTSGDVRGIGENFTQLQEFHQRVIKWGEWDEGAFRVVHAENELEPLDKF